VATDRLITQQKTRARTLLGDENRYIELAGRMPQGRAAKPREIADMMAFLASERSGYTTGVIVTIDGGLSSGWG
jgi:NAD(P)-dependent dehydrogenase (short-subunit alcohol dehydrogenase family)